MVLAGLIGSALMPFSAFAWGDIGHRVICQITYEELKPEIKARVDALVAIDPKFRTFADACTAPDHPHIRSPEHYVDLPRSAKGIDVQHPCPVADRCVISAILNDTRDLALSLDVSDQLRLLKSLGHWVGDVHQPLHVSSAIAERPGVQYCVRKDDACWYGRDQLEYRGGAQRVVAVNDAYLTAQAATVRERLKMAGVRLAAILNTALMPS